MIQPTLPLMEGVKAPTAYYGRRMTDGKITALLAITPTHQGWEVVQVLRTGCNITISRLYQRPEPRTADLVAIAPTAFLDEYKAALIELNRNPSLA